MPHMRTALVFLGIAAVMLFWQATSGRLPTGLALATPWAVSAAALAYAPRAGAWLGAIVAAASLVAAGWVFILSGSGQGRDVAEAFFASPDGTFSWAGVGITSALLSLLFLLALLLAGRKILQSAAGPDRAAAK
jgi:hypothetical protein